MLRYVSKMASLPNQPSPVTLSSLTAALVEKGWTVLAPGAMCSCPARPGCRHIAAPTVVDSTTSTNDLARQRAQAGDPSGSLVIARSQAAGRGRLDRTWIDDGVDALLMSVVLRPPVGMSPTHWGWIPLLASLAIVRAATANGASVGVKWPNDVVGTAANASGQITPGDPPTGGVAGKCAGILAEAEAGAIIVGMGINRDLTGEGSPVPGVGTLIASGMAPLTSAVVAAEVIDAGFVLWEQILRHGSVTSALSDEYRAACSTIGQVVRVELPGGSTLRGVATDLGPSGELLVQTEGKVHTVTAGDVIHVRSGETPGRR